MNTETKVHEHNMAQFEEKYGVYRNAYNAGKSDVIQAFVERVKKSLEQYDDTDGIKKKYVIQILDKYLKEALGNED